MGYGLPVTGNENRFVDLTGGYGVDTYFLSELFDHTDYVEQNAELCRIAEHNFKRPTPDNVLRTATGSPIEQSSSPVKGGEISIHNCTAEDFLSSPSRGSGGFHLIFLDPARRDCHGGKVFRLEDCTPNVVALLPTLLQHLQPGGRILLKLSPMLDITQAIKELSAVSNQYSAVSWDIHVVAIKNEVKEVLLSRKVLTSTPIQAESQEPTITAIDLAEPEKAFVFTREEEHRATSLPFQGKLEGAYLYEPNAAILKAGAYKLIAEQFGLRKLDVNTHLYTSETFVENFPGRVFKALPLNERNEVGPQANVLVRNYPLTPEQLKKKLHLRDGGTAFVIGCRVDGKPSLFIASRVN